MRIELKCSQCEKVLKYEVKKFERNEVDYIAEPCACTDLENNPEYGHCGSCEA